MSRVKSVRTAQMQRARGPEDTEEFTDDQRVITNVFKNFKADNFVKAALFVSQIVQVVVLERKASGISSSVTY